MKRIIRHSKKLWLIGSLILIAGQQDLFANEINIIPRPLQTEIKSGVFRLSGKTTIGYKTPKLKEQAEYLQKILSRSTGFDIRIREGFRNADICLDTDSTIWQKLTSPISASLRRESYQLQASSKKIQITGGSEAGVFYGIQSLLQLFPANIYNERRQENTVWEIPAIEINDAPQRPWRGMMLDVARYFYDKEFVKKYIDMMAMYKLNKLQFHMIDDSGWRLEIKKYPKLTEIGAWAGPDHRRLGGYYTQEDIREIIEYGRLRNVEIIPEIEFPAHMLSAIVAYPWLSCTGEQHEVPEQHFISRDLLCVGKESSYQFLRDILEETVNLFPSAYINIGGDEAVYTRWKECPDCQKVMRREGIEKVQDLQGYLTNVVAGMMQKKQRTIVGWEEIIQRGKINHPVVAVIWHNVGDTIQATRTGHKAILTPATHMYFDFPESRTPGEVKAATWMPPISVEKCYGMEVNDYSEASTVLGVQGCFWSDQFIHGTVLQEITPLNENRSETYAEYLTYPRLLALSEVAWSPKALRNYQDFATRLTTHYQRLDNKECNYRVPEPVIEKMEEKSEGGIEFTLAPSVAGAEIRYTTDGSYPTIHAPRYTGPVTVAQKSDFHAITVVNQRHYSLPIYFAPDYSAYKEYGEFTTEWKPLQVQTKPTKWRFECTGKISGNGTYKVHFIRTKGTNDFALGRLELFKRDEKLASIAQQATATPNNPVVTYEFQVDAFEAGTPFYIDVEACGQNGNDTWGLVFVQKLN